MSETVPVKVRIKPGDTQPIPANTPNSYEVTCDPPQPVLIDWGKAHVPDGAFKPGAYIYNFANLMEKAPEDLNIEPGSTLIVAAQPSEYERLDELSKFVESSHLSERNITIDVSPHPESG